MTEKPMPKSAAEHYEHVKKQLAEARKEMLKEQRRNYEKLIKGIGNLVYGKCSYTKLDTYQAIINDSVFAELIGKYSDDKISTQDTETVCANKNPDSEIAADKSASEISTCTENTNTDSSEISDSIITLVDESFNDICSQITAGNP